MSQKSRLIVVDVSNFIFRAFFAVRPLTAPDGTPVNAVHGVLSMFLKLLSQYRPTHVLMARDTSGGSFRNEMYEEYKANRSAPPEDLVPQFALIKRLIDEMGLRDSSHEDYEADDIIGTAVTQWKDKFDEILIASGDKDLMQFVDGNVKMLDTMKDITYDASGVFEKMGVKPEQIVDYLSMVGDSSDNVPGMRGIGAKGAAKLLAEHGSFDACVEAKDTFKGKKLTTAFSEYLDDAYLSRKLVQIVTDVDLGLTAEETESGFYPNDNLIGFLKELGFNSMIKRMEDMKYQMAQADQMGEGEEAPSMDDLFTHNIVDNKEKYSTLLELLTKTSEVAIQTEFDSEDIYTRKLIAISFSFDDVSSHFLKITEDNFEEIYQALWGREDLEISSEHSKREISLLYRNGKTYKAKNFDIVQAHYVSDPGLNHSIESLASSVNVVLTKLDKKVNFITDLEDEVAAKYSGNRAITIHRVSKDLKPQLKEKELESIYFEMDKPVLEILTRMEFEGVRLNIDFLKELESELQEKIDSIQAKINSFSINEVNLNSPKQVGELLFTELSFPVVKKTKTGFSTDSSVLEELDSQNINEVPGLILQYRELGKILSTYVKALPELVNSETGKLHTNFNQHVAQTGRLSSVNPNLQNIPIRSETGRRVRKGFIAGPGNILLAADYSQVELRLLAHFSQDPTMVKAFSEGLDIHAQTASEITGHSLSEITSAERGKAKAVNFGLMYGQSSFGLAKALKISRKEAKSYIEKYFERFSKIKGYLDCLKEEAEKTGYSITMNGRKRYLPEINSANRTIKANAERMAINSPIQGTAADIIKLAMIKIDSEIKAQGLKSKMLLQVHDELIFEVPEDELGAMKVLVKEGMENIVSLSVPLSVDMGIGVNWFDLK
ncbi:MAG: DNA polymerase I [Bacteriovorax sp. MedPE-SWde]|nr:MAG: DNA polymerase I [Bacteriovorax sp. MedPE-SWde]